MDIKKLKNLYNINIYEIYKFLKNSGKTEFDNYDLAKIFEYYSCIKLMDEYIILMEQLNNEIIKYKPYLKNKILLLGDKNNIIDETKDIIICVYNSVNLIKDIEFEKIFIDEAHHINTPEIYTLFNDDYTSSSNETIEDGDLDNELEDDDTEEETEYK